jgi:uncharacterized membrane protein YgdD (TMEM256/DUF423 family)
MPSRNFRLFLSLSGLIGVILGALGAHSLEASLTASHMLSAWQTAVHYQLVHTVALLALTAWMSAQAALMRPLLRWTGYCWMVGIVLFSGSLYALALGGPKWVGPITPLGGLALIVGWSLLVVDALISPAPSRSVR